MHVLMEPHLERAAQHWGHRLGSERSFALLLFKVLQEFDASSHGAHLERAASIGDMIGQRMLINRTCTVQSASGVKCILLMEPTLRELHKHWGHGWTANARPLPDNVCISVVAVSHMAAPVCICAPQAAGHHTSPQQASNLGTCFRV